MDVKDTIQKINKTKFETKKELEESIANGKRNKNTDMHKNANNCTANEEDAVKVIQRSCAQEFEEIIKSKKSNSVWYVYYQGQIFQKIKEKQRFVSDMVLEFNVIKSTIMFKIALSKLIDHYPKIKDSSLSLHYFFKKIKNG